MHLQGRGRRGGCHLSYYDRYELSERHLHCALSESEPRRANPTPSMSARWDRDLIVDCHTGLRERLLRAGLGAARV